MNESLREWRRYYCDSSEGSQKCARYALSMQGEVVPLGLLPNGRHAQHIQLYAADTVAAPAVSAASVDAAGGAAAVRVLPETVDDPGAFQPMGPTGEPRVVVERPVASPFVPRPRQPSETSRPVREPRRPARRWWTRLTDWMRGPYE
ncbi:hypothetical protein [Pseudonocardia endophytica]|nr:hypothetical protein [Pseudonocardia endophytica]